MIAWTVGRRVSPNRSRISRSPPNFSLGPEGYLNHIRRAKEAVEVPIIASLNGATVGGWTEYATAD